MTPKTFAVGEIFSEEGVNNQLLLIENLMARMDFNDKTGHYTIKGTITKKEFNVLSNWYNTVADGQYNIMKKEEKS